MSPYLAKVGRTVYRVADDRKGVVVSVEVVRYGTWKAVYVLWDKCKTPERTTAGKLRLNPAGAKKGIRL